jgi:hypothetical protein
LTAGATTGEISMVAMLGITDDTKIAETPVTVTFVHIFTNLGYITVFLHTIKVNMTMAIALPKMFRVMAKMIDTRIHIQATISKALISAMYILTVIHTQVPFALIKVHATATTINDIKIPIQTTISKALIAAMYITRGIEKNMLQIGRINNSLFNQVVPMWILPIKKNLLMDANIMSLLMSFLTIHAKNGGVNQIMTTLQLIPQA